MKKIFTFITLCLALVSANAQNLSVKSEVLTFEDVDLGANTYYNGSDGSGLFAISEYSFMNYYNADWSSWCGFGASATTGTDFAGYGTESEFNSCVGGGYESKQFAVGYFSEYNYYMEGSAPAIYATSDFSPEYVYVTNTACAYQSMLNGDTYAKKFTDEDWFKLIITGMNVNDEKTGSVEVYLAKDGKILNEWVKVDLTPLGTVNHINFTMASSDSSYGFMNTPAYFCLDNMKVNMQTTDVESVLSSVSVASQKAYDMSGRQVSKEAKGLIIVNGKKFFRK